MRFWMDAVFLWAYFVCAFCCASSFAPSSFAEEAIHEVADSNPITILKPAALKLHLVGDQEVVLRSAPKPKFLTAAAIAKPESATAVTPIAGSAIAGTRIVSTQQSGRAKIESKVLLPPAGATPEPMSQVMRSPLAPLPIEVSGIMPIPATPQRSQPVVSTAEADAAGDPSAIQQVVYENVRPTHQVYVPTRRTSSPSRLRPQNRIRPLANISQPAAHESLVPAMVKPVGAAQKSNKRFPVRQVADNQIPAAGRTSDRRVSVPTKLAPVPDDVSASKKDEHGLMSLQSAGAELPGVLRLIADRHDLNLVLGPEVEGPVTVNINGARMDEILDAILGVAGFTWHIEGHLLYVTGKKTEGMDPRVQGRTLHVYPLDYVSASDLESVANGLLSPVGTVFVTTSSTEDQLKTRELLVVEDTAAAHHRIAQYIAQVDVPPRQVLIEAHVLQVALSEDERHGINLKALARFQGARLALSGSGFASEDPSGPSVALQVDGTDMNGLIELIRQQTNSRTLASPKVSVVNHQEAKIQIGQRLPYSVATTTQTSTVQNVQFLDVGIVLTVTPVITEDGNILMTVLPKVSGGKITENGFPEEDTTEVQTTVLMPDGGGIVIGGLIREDNSHASAIVPGFGRIPVVGHLFRKKADEARRNELIVALVTHVLPDVYSQRAHEQCELNQTVPNYSRQDLRHPPLPMRGQHYHK